VRHFGFDLPETTARSRMFLEQGLAAVYLAGAGSADVPAGFVALSPCNALYAEGAFGIITELYVAPSRRAAGIGRRLLEAAKAHGRERNWRRLEVTTPPLPEFERTLRFYEREGFAVTGGRKLKVLL
jgi:GNAT superfamily N-acetyltransferase